MAIRLGAALSLTGVTVLQACGPAPPFHARFAVRGRWPDPRAVVFRIETENAPASAPDTRAAIRSALDAWEETGCATFREARTDETPTLVFAWMRGAHGDCVPFGADPSVAHAGPPGPGSFVHFDAGRNYGPGGLSLRQAALHETGHVLGLDHSPDEHAVMYAEPSPDRDRLAASDLAGIHSLYGGGVPGPGDLVVLGPGASVRLSGVAPPEISDWTVFDTDGDGDDEVLVWRTDAAGHGELWSYHFEPGPELARTLGPLYGAVGPGLTIELARTEAGERLLILEPERGAVQARIFDDQGIPQVFGGEIPPDTVTRGTDAGPRRGDLDGDGELETITRD